MNKNQYLPIGSVVLLYGMKERTLIFGRQQENKQSGMKYDYVGCGFPEGIQNSNDVLLFNREDIQMVFAVGYQDREEFYLREYLEKMDQEEHE